ncbi:hypothetical protein KOW79_020814 [Hemibagrus wyckioides]|uniref:Uncharacterized protein n=1 Tax=Hemibagrus wyckioides TaxID=337641 RepID=A0A9D3SDL6_9TELE|nr:hypothetical protein KOW79_020814 [Hemibagrus wyckioides]
MRFSGIIIDVNISRTTVALLHQDKFGFLMECRASLHVPNADTQKKGERKSLKRLAYKTHLDKDSKFVNLDSGGF